MIFVPIPLPRKALQTSYCTHLLFKDILQTGLGMGMGMNGTAQVSRLSPLAPVRCPMTRCVACLICVFLFSALASLGQRFAACVESSLLFRLRSSRKETEPNRTEQTFNSETGRNRLIFEKSGTETN